MCGICGIFDYNNRQIDKAILKKMTDVMIHRGPDDQGHFVDAAVGLGHRRLSIIDLSSGHQPLSNENSTLWVVYNGEIFNFKELRRELEKKGHIFSTQTDTEVIIHAYESYGVECVKRFRGQFAFAVWDSTKKRLFIARDRLGIKPLYYAYKNNQFLFSSEIKSLLINRTINPEICIAGLNKYLSLGYVWGEDTLFEGIKKLEPGTFMIIDEHGTKEPHTYWNAAEHAHPVNKPFSFYCDSIKDILTDATSMRLISDVPLGAFLSGGIDSSIMVALMSRSSPQPIDTFSVSFRDEKYDESSYANLVAQKYNTNHHVLFGDDDIISILEKIVWHLDEPLADCAVIPTYIMSQLTKQFVTVVLSGDGGDEIFAGYNKYIPLAYMPSIGRFPGISPAVVNYFLKGKISSRSNASSVWSDVRNAYFRMLSSYDLNERTALFCSREASLDCEQSLVNKIDKDLHPLIGAQLLDLMSWLPDDILLKTDKIGMAFNLETRLPFLDHVLVENAFTMPVNYKLRVLTGKYIIKQAFQDILPSQIIKKRKHGFDFPFESLIPEKYLDTLFEDSPLYSILQKKHIRDIIERRYSQPFYGNKFRTLFFLFLWHKIFIENSANFLD
ncbi:MAG: asparagine synthase (glutamine-hydrolyzing) [Chitinivibrionales bacterium]|nr:asparagine synthase (glutamine-hydrolyzing) [Chitinivibrionales bacterium]